MLRTLGRRVLLALGGLVVLAVAGAAVVLVPPAERPVSFPQSKRFAFRRY